MVIAGKRSVDARLDPRWRVDRYMKRVGMMKKTIDGLAAHDFDAGARAAIERGNAARLFPRLAFA